MDALLTQNKRALLAIKELKAQLASAELRGRAPIAIVGMACRFPGGCATPAALWDLLRGARDAVGDASPARWPEALYDPDPGAPGRIATRGLGMIDSAAEFDPEFFHVSPREARSMDPQHRVLLEVAWEACEDAGLTRDGLSGSRTGIFIGAGNNDYGDFELRNPDLRAVHAHTGTGNAAALAAGRLAFFLGSHGPALVIDTACSSSLVAVHQACQSLRQGESEIALAGGINLILRPHGSVFLSRVGALSPTGRCRAFAEAADGYVRADGCAVVALKRLADAERDRDRIWAVIRGSAINHDGRSGGLTVPNGAAQRDLLRAALHSAGVEPARVTYLEAHGTGTPLGDPIEMGAIAEVFGGPRSAPLRVGSIKSNIGHTEAAAGLAGLLKAVLALRHRAIPAHLHFAQPSSRIAWPHAIEVPTELTAWHGEAPLTAGVSAFGFSGTNVHVIVEEAPARTVAHAARTGPQILCLSASHDRSLGQLAAAYRDQLAHAPQPIADLCHAAARRRTHHRRRIAVIASSATALAERLDHAAAGTYHPDVVRGEPVLDAMSRTAFVFSGQGSQWLGMGRELLGAEPVFRDSLHAIDAGFRAEFGWSLLDALHAPAEVAELDRTRIAQPVLVAIQIALSELWQSWGVIPDAVLGHSLGELAAAQVAGVLGRDQAVRLAGIRGQIMEAAHGRGQMIELACGEDAARGYLDGLSSEVAIAAVNGPAATVLAGNSAALDAIIARVAADGVKHRRLRVSYAFHAPQMRPLGAPFAHAIGALAPRTAERAIYSSVHGRAVAGAELTAAYWARNLTDEVRFHDAVVALLRDGHRAIVEIAPHPVLLAAIRDAMSRERSDGVAVFSLRRGAPEIATLLGNAGALYAAGYPIAWSAIYPGAVDHVELPAYPWHNRPFWTTAAAGDAPAPLAAGATDHATAAAPRATLLHELAGASRIARRARLEHHVRDRITSVLRLDPEIRVARRTQLGELGMDSVGAIELCAQLSLTPGHTVRPTVVFEHPTIDGLTEFLLAELDRLGTAGAAPGDAGAGGAAAAIPAGAPAAAQPPEPSNDPEIDMLDKLAAFEKEFA